jgi:hypothetical protein
MALSSEDLASANIRTTQLNRTVDSGYLWVIYMDDIRLVNITAYLSYLEITQPIANHGWYYDTVDRVAKAVSTSQVSQFPSLTKTPPTTPNRPPYAIVLPNENINNNVVPKTTKSSFLSKESSDIIPYIIGFVLLFFLFIAITNRASQ